MSDNKKIDDVNLEIPESVRTLCGSDTNLEYQQLLDNRKKWGSNFKNQEQLDFFLLLPLNEEQRKSFMEALNVQK